MLTELFTSESDKKRQIRFLPGQQKPPLFPGNPFHRQKISSHLYSSRSFASFAVKYLLLFFHREEHKGTRRKTKINMPRNYSQAVNFFLTN